MKKFILIVLTVTLIIIGALAYLLFKSVNASSYQQQIISAVSELTGRTLTVSGQSSFKWMPMPTLVMNDIQLSNHQGSDKQSMLTADSMEIQIEWDSIFKTPLVVKSVELVNPTLYLERLENNRANWSLPFFFGADADISDMHFFGQQYIQNETKIDKLKIKNGRILYNNKITQHTSTINKINGDLSVDSPKGPYRFDGTVEVYSTLFKTILQTEKLRNDMPSKVTAEITQKDSGLDLDFTGQIEPNNPKLFLQGDASFAITYPNILMEKAGLPVLNDIFKQKAVGSLSFQITPLEDKLNNFVLRFETGENPFALTTKLTYQPKTNTTEESYAGELVLNTIDYTAFKPYFDKLDWSLFSDTENNIPALNIKLTVPEVKLPTGNIRKISGLLSFKQNQLTFTEGQASLADTMPVTFRITGKQTKNGPELSTHLKGKTNTPQPLLNLIGLTTTVVNDTESSTKQPDEATPSTQKTAFNKIKEIDADMELILSPTSLYTIIKKLKINETVLDGAVSQSFNDKKETNLIVDIKNLNVDTYTGWTPSTTKHSLSSLPTLLRQAAANASFLLGKNIRILSNIDALTWHGLPIKTAKIDAQLSDGSLSVSNAEFSGVVTAHLKTAGIIGHVGTPSADIEKLSFSFSAEQLPLFLNRANLDAELPLIKTATNTKIAGTITGQDDLWKLNLLSQLNDMDLKIQGSVAKTPDNIRFDNFIFNIAHPNFHKLLSLLNINTKSVENLNGALKAQGTLNGTPNDFVLSNTDIGIGIQKINGTLSYADKGVKKVSLTGFMPTLEAERILPRQNFLTDETGALSKKTFDFSAWNDWDIDVDLKAGRLTYKALDLGNAHIAFTLKDKLFTLTDLSGTGQNNKQAQFKASGSLSYVTDPTLKASITVMDLGIRPDFMIAGRFSFGGGKMGIKGDFDAIGTSVADMVSNLNGKGTALFSDGQFLGVDLQKAEPFIRTATAQKIPQNEFDAQLDRLLKLGKTPVDSIQGAFSIARGIVRFMDMTVKTSNAVANPTQIIWNIPQNTLEITMPFIFNTLTQYPPILLNINFDKNVKSYMPDFTALSNTIGGQINKELVARQQAETIAQEQEQAQMAQAHAETIKSAIAQANTVVRETISNLQGIGDEKVGILLQNATDALNVVNELAVKTTRTSEQDNMLMTYAKTAIEKAQEAQKVAEETVLNHQYTIKKLTAQATDMANKITALEKSMPYIAILPKLAEQTNRNLNIILSAQRRLNNADETGQAAALAEAMAAYQAIESTYSNAIRFETSGTINVVPENGENKVRGQILRR